MKLGKHVSISGGLDKAPQRAKDIGCNCLQIFVKNPRGWKARAVPEAEVIKVKEEMRRLKMSPLIIHSSYLINLASPGEELWEKSIKGLIEEYTRAGRIGADYLVIHPGNHTGSGITKGIARVSRALSRVLNKVKNETTILLENVAGSGSGIGSIFVELYDIIINTDDNKRLGICLDTCHAFAAGYDLSNIEKINHMLAEIDEKLGLHRLKMIHLNDSKYALGTNKDEHAHIGKGTIGEKGIKAIINHQKLKHLPFILETPQFENQDKDVEKVYSLRKD